MEHQSAKAAKEEFVAGHHGTSLHEINAVIGIVPLAALLLCCLGQTPAYRALLTNVAKLQLTFLRGVGLRSEQLCLSTAVAATLLLEFYVTLLPAIGVMMGVLQPATLFSWVAAASVVPCGVLVRRLWGRAEAHHHVVRVVERLAVNRPRFISHYRGAMMLCTCIAILAVDFRAFPRRFAKAEAYGTGLMDVGVGSFIGASGIVAGSKGLLVSRHSIPDQDRKSSAVPHIVALTILGCVRLVLTKLTGYQHPVSEYGVHWNFFFTLAGVKILTEAMPLTAMPRLSGVMIAAGHQYFLSHGSIDYIHSDARSPSWFSLNKEGWRSLPGYWALHLLAVSCGQMLAAARIGAIAEVMLQHNPRASVQLRMQPLWRFVLKLATATAALWAAMAAVTTWVQPVSRRACNAAYILWMLAFNMQVLTIFAAIDVLEPYDAVHVFEDANSYMLPLFLLANLLTGCINLAIDTLAVGDWAARGIVAGYLFVLCSVATLMSPRRKQ